jgi:subtilase family serine protease
VVVNQGNAPAAAFRVSWNFGSGSGGQNVPCCLGPNQSYTLEWTSLPLYTSYNTRAMADESQSVQESNESNNTLERWVNVPPAMPNLSWYGAGAIHVHSGEQVNEDIYVKNFGNAPAGPFAVWWRYGVDASQVCQWDVPGLGSGEHTALWCTVTIYSAYRAQGYIDQANSVQESDEGDNTFGFPIEID